MKQQILISCTVSLLASAIGACLVPAYAATADGATASVLATGQGVTTASAQSGDQQTTQADSTDTPKAASAKAAKKPGASSASNTTNLSEVKVTGQLASLRKAQATKRDAIGVVDSISAEEAGKFPDLNVADSLQRVPGVSVNRSSGEANQVTVRGFGPTFVTVLINGRAVPSASTDRAFDFNTLSSDVIEQAVVHKTSSADMQAGGIGGTIDIITAKPLDFSGFHASGSLSGGNDYLGSSISGKTTPRVSAIIGDSNSDHTFGWLASASYYKDDHTDKNVAASGWIPNLDYTALNPAYTNISMPQSLEGNVQTFKRTRKTFNGALQWNPNDQLSVDLNTLYSEYKDDEAYRGFGSYTNTGDIQSLTADDNGTALNYTRFNTGSLSNDYITEGNPADTKTVQNGLHVNYQFNTSTEVDFDTSYSQSWNKQSANSYFTVIGTRNIGVNPVWRNNGDNKLPSYSNLISTTDTTDLLAHCCQEGQESPNVSDKIQENKLHFSKTFMDGALSRVDFGLYESEDKKTQVNTASPNNLLCGEYCGYTSTVPADVVGAYVFNGGNFDNFAPGFPTQWVSYDPAKYFAYLATPAAYNQRPNPAAFAALLAANGGTFAARPNSGTYSKLQERIQAAYGQATFEGNLGQMPWTLVAGMRYTKTNTTSSAYSVPLLAITVNPQDTSNAIPTFGVLSPIALRGNYSDWLPSAAFKLNLRDNLVFRLAASKSLTRPDINNLSAAQTFNFRPTEQTLNTGNAALLPYTSKNIDTGMEWYINDSSYVSLDAFYKKVSNFVTLVTEPGEILGFPFQITKPINLNSAIIKGAELTFNYQFSGLPRPFNGLGVATNYTYVTSSASASGISTTGKFAVPGIGNSSNFGVYYDEGPVQVRLAYNWRQAYLSTIAGQLSQPTTVKSYGQLDFSGSYAINPSISVFLDLTNLNNEKIYNYQVFVNRENYAEEDGRTARVGVRVRL